MVAAPAHSRALHTGAFRRFRAQLGVGLIHAGIVVYRTKMPDSLFFPASALFAGLLVFLALQPFADRPPSGPVSAGAANAEDVTIANDQLRRFLPGEVGGISFQDEAGETTIRLSRLAEYIYEDPRMGTHLVVAEDLEYAFENRPIEITIEARSTGEVPATEFEANYLARPGEESGWQTFTLTREFAPYVLEYTPPRRGETLGYDFLGVRPVVPEKRRTMEIRSIRFRAAGPKALQGE